MNIKKIIKKIINRGYQKGQNQFEKRRVLFFNIVILFILAATLIMIFVAQSLDSKFLNITALIVFFLLYYAHKFKPKLSVLLLGFVYQAFIFLHSSFLDIGGQVEYAILAMAITLPIFFRKRWAFYFLISNFFIFYYPYLILEAYQSFFKLAYISAIGLFFVIWVFVAENEKYEKVLIKKQRELKELNKEKNHLIQVVAHDLKSPLNQIEGMINLINLSKENEAFINDYMGKIVNSVHDMSSMITRILDIERIEKGESLKLVPIEIISILKSVTDKFKVLAFNKDIQIEVKIPSTPIWINGDSHYLEQIFHNVLSNAIKFSPKGKRIWVKVAITGEKVQVKIIDEGPGISVLDQKNLFKKFQKLSAQPTDNEDSTGLGLALTKSFVISMAGKITCESELGHRTSFIIEFMMISVSSSGN